MNRRILSTALGLWFAISLAPASANEAENRIKAAFLYKFCDYIQWPDQAFSSENAPLVIGVVGDSAFAEDVKVTVSGRQIKDRSFQVLEVMRGDTLDGIHILFISDSAATPVEDLVPKEDNWPILTVTNNEDLSPLSIINFVIVNQRVRFDISQNRAQQVGLKLSSELLSVARNVRQGSAP